MKKTETAEQLLQRFSKRTMQLSSRNAELKPAYDEYVKNERALARLEGSVKLEYMHMVRCLYGNHDGMKDHKPH